MTACKPTTELPKPPVTPGEWLEFEGSWNAAGSRRIISLGAERRGSILDLTGTMLLAGPKRPGVGFRSEVIALVDSDTGLEGRSVWTDEHGRNADRQTRSGVDKRFTNPARERHVTRRPHIST